MEYLYVAAAMAGCFGLGVGLSNIVKAAVVAQVNKGLDWLKSKV